LWELLESIDLANVRSSASFLNEFSRLNEL
jgi:hypothetical protein